MAQITIQDSGYLKTDNSGTQLTGSEISNSGNAIVLKTAKLNYNGGANLDDTPYIGTYDNPDINQIGHTATNIVITAHLHNDNTTEMGYLGKLLRLRKTRGYKLIFYDGASEELPSEESIYQIAQEEGRVFTSAEKTKFSITNTGICRIPCHVKNVSINDSAKQGVIIVTLICKVTKDYSDTL